MKNLYEIPSINMVLTGGLCLFFLPAIALGQPAYREFAPVGAEWYYQDYSPGCGAERYTRLRSDRDTVVNDRECRVIEVYKSDSEQPLTELIVCDEEGEVSFYEDDMFKLLYDFTLRKGDTLTFNVPRNRQFFEYSCLLDTFSLDNPYRALVTWADSILIEGTFYRRLITEPLPDDVDCFDLGTIYERIGSLNGFAGFDCIQCLVGCAGHFRCYRDDFILFQLSEENCEFTTGLARPGFFALSMRLYPNPSAETVTVDLPGETRTAGRYRIADLTGRIMWEGAFTGIVKVAGLAPGSYMLSVVLDSGRGYMGRFIVGR